MKKVRVMSPEAMEEAQVSEDASMTPLERLKLAFKLSEFAIKVQKSPERPVEEQGIRWIELHKASNQVKCRKLLLPSVPCSTSIKSII